MTYLAERQKRHDDLLCADLVRLLERIRAAVRGESPVNGLDR